MDDFAKITNTSKALADKTRFEILRLIAKSGEISCKKITAMIPLSQPAISHHLKILINSKLVNVHREGQWGYFSLNKKVFNEFLKLLKKEVK